ncbi:hypothetical protein J4E80_010778 [Alternaria sp. BMP 0032]|nr:hypothetical protein J4E80_010778 [Alternaria sp. BMP 0032]
MSHEDLAELLKKPQLSRSGELSYMLATPRVDRHAGLVLPSGVETSAILNDDFNAAAKLGTRALIGKAVVIRTTASVATTPSFNVIRQSHAVFLEEAGRASDAKIAGFFSHFWNACLRMFIGSVNQLGPAAFVQNNENPFAKQLALSTCLLWATAGLEINELNQTSRVKNLALLELGVLATDMPQLQAGAGSFDNSLSAKHATVNKAIWGIDSNLMFVNDIGGSSYSLETAAAVMKDAVHRMEHMVGDSHTIISPKS